MRRALGDRAEDHQSGLGGLQSETWRSRPRRVDEVLLPFLERVPAGTFLARHAHLQGTSLRPLPHLGNAQGDRGGARRPPYSSSRSRTAATVEDGSSTSITSREYRSSFSRITTAFSGSCTSQKTFSPS